VTHSEPNPLAIFLAGIAKTAGKAFVIAAAEETIVRLGGVPSTKRRKRRSKH
jgi:hypothetical protein